MLLKSFINFGIILIITFYSPSYAQNQNTIDSLTKQLQNNSLSDLNKAKIYYNLAREYFGYDNDKMKEYLDKAENLIINLTDKNDKIFAQVYIAKANLYSVKYQYDQSDSIYKKAIKFARKIHGPEKNYYILSAREGIALNLMYRGKLNEALDIYNELEQKTSVLDTSSYNNQKLKNLIVSNKAIILARLGKLEEALKYFIKSKNFNQKNYANDKSRVQHLVNSLNNIALCYNMLQKKDSAINTYIEALEIAKENHLTHSVNRITANLGDLFITIGNNEKCIYYSKQVEDETSIPAFSSYNNMGNAYTNLKQYEKGIEQYKKALSIAQKINNPEKIIKAHVNLSINYSILKKLDSAYFHIRKAEEINQKLNNKNTRDMLDEAWGEYYFQKADYPKAISYYKRYLQNKLKTKQASGNIQRAMEHVYKAYKSLNKPQKALFWLEKKDSLEHVLDSISFNHKIYDIEAQYQTKEKEAKILQLSNENLKKEAELNHTKNIVYLSTGIFTAFLATGFFMWHRRKQQQKLELLQAGIKASEAEKKHIGKELHDGIAGNLIRLVHEVEDKDIALADKLLKTYNEIRNLSHQLNNTPMHGENLYDRLAEIIPQSNDKHKFVLRIKPAELSLPEPLGTHVFRIIQELITNNLKYAHADFTVIDIQQKGQQLHISYSDNGIGAKNLKKGSGLKNMEDRVALMKGKIKYTTGNGFEVKIEIPL